MIDAKQTARVVGIGLLMLVAIDFVGSWLRDRTLGMIAVQVAIAEFGAGKLAIAWSPPSAQTPTFSSIARRFGRGAIFGLATAAACIGSSVLSRTLAIRAGTFEIATIAMGVVVAALTAARDELLLRGLVLRATQNIPRPLALAACAAAAVARVWFADGTTPIDAILAATAAIGLACIWLVDRGAWMAVGANAAYIFATDTLVRGPLDAAGTTSRASAIAMGLASAAAVAWWRRQPQRE